VIVQRVTQTLPMIAQTTTLEELLILQAACREVYVDPALVRYAVNLVAATRAPAQVGLEDMRRLIVLGASPRASIALIEAARALALMRGRRYVLGEDLTALTADVLRHRLILSYEAMAECQTADRLIARIQSRLTVPREVLRSC
jgi:MoxR-like ATPases